MKAFIAILSAELLKLKRSIALQMVLLIPLLIILLMVGTLLNKHPENYNREMFQSMLRSVYVSWLILVLPMFMAIETGLISGSEQASGQWKHIFCLPIPRGKILFAKWLVGIGVMLGANLVLALLFILAFPLLRIFLPQIDFVFYLSSMDFLNLLIGICVTSLGIASLHFAFTLLLPGLIPSIGLGISAVILSMGITWAEVGIDLSPWTLPLIPLSRYVPLEMTFSLTRAVGLSVGVSLLCLLVSIPLFIRKDVL